MTFVLDLRAGPTKEAVCPHCGKILSGASQATPSMADIDDEPARPQPGNLSICNRCGGVGRYTEDGQIELQPESELDEETMAVINEARRVANFILPDMPSGRPG